MYSKDCCLAQSLLNVIMQATPISIPSKLAVSLIQYCHFTELFTRVYRVPRVLHCLKAQQPLGELHGCCLSALQGLLASCFEREYKQNTAAIAS